MSTACCTTSPPQPESCPSSARPLHRHRGCCIRAGLWQAEFGGRDRGLAERAVADRPRAAQLRRPGGLGHTTVDPGPVARARRISCRRRSGSSSSWSRGPHPAAHEVAQAAPAPLAGGSDRAPAQYRDRWRDHWTRNTGSSPFLDERGRPSGPLYGPDAVEGVTFTRRRTRVKGAWINEHLPRAPAGHRSTPWTRS